MKTRGSCLCGEVRFEIEGSFEHFFLCHCKYCQKDTGSSYASNLFSTTASLRWLSGENRVKVFNLPSTLHVKSFCSNCGSALPGVQMNGNLIVVPAGSLDEMVMIKPDAHIFTASKADWERDLDTIPESPGSPD